MRPYVIWDCRCKKSLLYFKPPYDYITKLGPTSPASWHFKDPCINIQTTRTIKSGVWYFQMPFLWKIPISLFYLYISHSTMLQKLSKCEVKAALLGYFSILLPLRFYVKSNFDVINGQKMPFLPILEVLNCDFSKSEQFFKSQIYQNSKFRVSKTVKKAIYAIQILPKLISRKIGWLLEFLHCWP